MRTKQNILLTLIFGIPFLLGVGVIGYWYFNLSHEKEARLPKLGRVPEFSLTSEQRHTISQNAFLGKASIVDFIFTSCGGACPLMSTKMSELQKELTNESRVQFISFSVDPETDTPDVLTTYARGYGAIQGKWIFLTGDKGKIYQLTREGFHLGLDIEGEDAIIHSQKFVLVDHRGEIRGYYDSEDDSSMTKLVTDVRLLAGVAAP